MLGHHIIRAYFGRVHKQVCKKVTLYLNKDMCAQGTLHPVWNTVRESHKTLLEEGPKGGVCVRFYEENKAHLRFTKIVDSHLRFTKIIRKYIGISWFSLRKHAIMVIHL